MSKRDEIFFEGNPNEVIQNILKYKNSKEGRPVFLILGGILRGVYGGGGVSALNDLQLTNGFHTVVGVSTGAPTAAYFLTNQGEVGSSIYYEECLTYHFSNIFRVIFRAKKYLDIGYLHKVWGGKIGSKRLDVEKIKESKTNLLIGLTDSENGIGELKRINDMNDLVCPLVASCSIPLLSETNVLCDGKYYTDGAMSLPFPVKEIISKVNPTSFLVFPNRDIGYKDSFWVGLWEWAVRFSVGKENIDKQGNFDVELKALKESGIPYLIIWTDNQVSGFTTKRLALLNAKKRYKKYVLELFQKYL